ncbi:acyl-CoA thioesterase II [Magnaporthiopsis poae ATCC 64411]|uniref:Acyl-CoA thioesterase II n=1 Tax=Magnaporthiopsis poae (strain ATCC 64411 / 73-15) TaxID=644358 RepID=A0A0C4DQN5_MAGP6|nr:acyl-CoA thioesterase II [Magnaporthiopsis poae ATCC 64411]
MANKPNPNPNSNGAGAGPAPYPTLVRPPPEDATRAQIENVLDVTELGVLGPDIFTNTRPPWLPPGARGIFGGAVIAMSLAAAQKTVPPEFLVHSLHCYFLLAGSADVPILLHVERVRDGRSFATRTVQARQRGRCIFTTTISLVRQPDGGDDDSEGGGGKRVDVVRHAAAFPADAPPPPPDDLSLWPNPEPLLPGGSRGPFQHGPITFVNRDSEIVHERRTRQWTRARGKISEQGGLPAHLCALAYMSDSYFMGTVPRIHNLWRFPARPEDVPGLDEAVRKHIMTMHNFENDGEPLSSFAGRPSIGMMVSLDHTIYFHEPRRVRADEWMLSEMESPWSGDGRGVVTQRIFSKDGTLLATCFQEGVLRLRHSEAEVEEPKAKL